ncbi:MAG TPA: glutamate--cysteine ligase, partial [Gammaproteobacteria bacterium]|nr:glutamate--cysteine ligase [Gammaproteobacteria bacterium]
MKQSPVIENKSQLIEYLASGCKPKSEWKVGTEHEKFGFHKDTLTPLKYAEKGGIRDILEGLRDKFDWQPQYEG